MRQMNNGSTLREAAVILGYITALEFDNIVKPEEMVKPGVSKKR